MGSSPAALAAARQPSRSSATAVFIVKREDWGIAGRGASNVQCCCGGTGVLRRRGCSSGCTAPPQRWRQCMESTQPRWVQGHYSMRRAQLSICPMKANESQQCPTCTAPTLLPGPAQPSPHSLWFALKCQTMTADTLLAQYSTHEPQHQHLVLVHSFTHNRGGRGEGDQQSNHQVRVRREGGRVCTALAVAG